MPQRFPLAGPGFADDQSRKILHAIPYIDARRAELRGEDVLPELAAEFAHAHPFTVILRTMK